MIITLGLLALSAPCSLAAEIGCPVIYTRVPLDAAQWFGDSRAGGMVPADFFDGSQLVLMNAKGEFRVISNGFQSACDPEVSFDGKRVLFAGKKSEADKWNIFEADLAGGTVRQITRDFGNCRSPRYMSTFYTIVSPEPWYTLAFASDESGEISEYGEQKSTNLYSCKLDGTGLQRLTYNPSNDFNPLILPDGRILYSTWQRNLPRHGEKGRIELFSILSDGTDIASFNCQGKRIKHMAVITPDKLVVFVESDSLPWDGAGSLASISLKRYARSYHPMNLEPGFYLAPSPLPDGRLMVSRRPADGTGNHDIYLLDPAAESVTELISDQRYHLMQAVAVVERKVPDGRSSVVNANDPNGQFYCLDIKVSDSGDFSANIDKEARRIRFIEGVPVPEGTGDPEGYLARRILGEAEIKPDGSFFAEVPANIPVKIQLIDEKGMSLRSGTWIWVRNHEPRGCIGCHEDPELVPTNRMVDAVKTPPTRLTLPPARRRSVSFRDNILPIVERRCSTASCHGEGSSQAVRFASGHGEDGARLIYDTLTAGGPGDNPGSGKYIFPGTARLSPLIWHLTGENTIKEWDLPVIREYNGIVKGPKDLTPEEIRLFIEWIDLGAHWSPPGRPTTAATVKEVK